MGQVYRATDTTLGRQVAIKILPAAFAADTERVARFEREAKTLASLNHPHIAAIYGFEKTASGHALVMELVDGEDLAHRLRSGAIPLGEVLPIAKQIADAIADAHERGIVHRDLKPANIKVTPDGAVKILDFGLAKAIEQGSGIGDQGSGNLANSPTITTPAMTQSGMILGTAAYMSPEQAKGRVADKRSDIWSFGCVLFEMLTGQKAFAGEDVSETLASILRADPDLTKLPPQVPQRLRTIIDGCLRKDRKQRFADIAVVQHLLDDSRASVSTGAVPVPGSSRAWKAATAILMLTTVGALGVPAYLSRWQPAPELTQFLIPPLDKGVFVTAGRTGTTVAISPDGRRLAYTQRDETGKILIWIRSLDALAARPLPGTDNAEFPFWSPDSRSLGFFAGGKLMKIDAGGGVPVTVCNAEGARGGAWGSQGEIVFGGGPGNGLARVATTGGQPLVVTKPETGDHRFPSFLPDGRHVLFYWQAPGDPARAGLHMASLDSSQTTRLAEADTGGVFAAPGSVLFGRQTVLLAQPFDAATLSLKGEPVPVAEHLESGVFGGVVSFSVSDTGTLAYGIGTGREVLDQLTWFDRQGKPLGTIGSPGNYIGVDLSPDEKQVAVHRHVQGTGGDLWLLDLARDATSRFTFEPGQDNFGPLFSPDGRHIAFSSLRKGSFELYMKPTNGTTAERLITVPERPAGPASWSRDGKYLVYVSNSDPWVRNTDVAMVPIDGGTPVPLLTSTFAEFSPAVSPDGKWLAYSSNETGRLEVYVRPFPSGDGKWQISTAGGTEARWRGDSKELVFLDRPQMGTMMAVAIDGSGPALVVGALRKLFTASLLTSAHPGPPVERRYAVSRDGQRFLMPVNPRSATFNAPESAPMAVVLNWNARLKNERTRE